MRYLAILFLFAGCGIHIEAMSATWGTTEFLEKARSGATTQTRRVDKITPKSSVMQDLVGEFSEEPIDVVREEDRSIPAPKLPSRSSVPQ